ncbi:hypothetical protein ACOMHN_022866 [Nucella lapillus]
MFFVLLSIAVFVLETHPIFRITSPGYNGTASRTVSSNYLGPGFCSCKIHNDALHYNNNSEPHAAMTYLDYLCAAFFTLEFLVRIYFAPNKLEFFKQPLNIIDILCLVPHFTSIIIKTVSPSDNAGNILRSVLALRVIRVLRIFKLMKHYTAFKILVYTIKVSTKELLLMVVFLFSGVLIFASVIYYVEPNTFSNIPIGFWWAIVTMTTVGYGDKVPFTEGGYILGFLCVLCGVLTVAFTVPIVVNNFTLYYAHAQSRNQLPPQKKRELQQKLIMKNQKATEFIKRLAINVQQRRNNNNNNNGSNNGGSRGREEKEEGERGFNPLEDLKTPRTTTSRWEYWVKEYWVKEYWAKEYWAKEYWVKEYWTKEYWVKEYWVKEYWVKEYWVKEYWTKEYWVKEYWVKEYWVKEYWAKEYWVKENSKDSGIDNCVPSPPATPRKPAHFKDSKPPLSMAEADQGASLGSFGAARQDGGSLGSLGAGRGEESVGSLGAGRPSSRIQTVSEIVPDVELPGTPDTGFSAEVDPKTTQMLETEQLLHSLQDFDDKKREERRRQLTRMNQRRDEVRARTTPRPSNVVTTQVAHDQRSSRQRAPDHPPSRQEAHDHPPSCQVVHDQPSSCQVAPDYPSSRQGAPDHLSSRPVAPDQPSSRPVAPDQPSSRQGAPDQPSSRQGAPDQPSSRQGAPDQPSTRHRAPDNSSSRQGAPDHPSSRQGSPDQPSSRQGAPDQPFLTSGGSRPSVLMSGSSRPAVLTPEGSRPLVLTPGGSNPVLFWLWGSRPTFLGL